MTFITVISGVGAVLALINAVLTWTGMFESHRVIVGFLWVLIALYLLQEVIN